MSFAGEGAGSSPCCSPQEVPILPLPGHQLGTESSSPYCTTSRKARAGSWCRYVSSRSLPEKALIFFTRNFWQAFSKAQGSQLTCLFVRGLIRKWGLEP